MEEETKPKQKKLSPVMAIRIYCKRECCANDTLSWRDCSCSNCSLFPYRLGLNPNRKGIGGKKKV
jgi:hypothetical protein